MSEPQAKTYPTRFGPMLAFVNDVYITRSLELYGEYCPAEWAMLQQLVRPGMTVVEMGANIGTHSVPLARACAPGPLHLFEPQQRVFQVLCANLALNDIHNAIAHPEACGAQEGWAVIPDLDYGAAINFGGVSVTASTAEVSGRRVRVTPLDALELPACHLVKIDVEGFEGEALAGAADTISRCRPRIYVENDRSSQQQALIDQLTDLGYRMYWHVPPLFSPDNFNGSTENPFGRIVSVNMLCLPNEDPAQAEMPQIDPRNWSSPIKLRK